MVRPCTPVQLLRSTKWVKHNRFRLCQVGRGIHSIGEASAGLRLALRLQRWDAAIAVVQLASVCCT